MSNFTLDDNAMSRLSARMQLTGVNQDALCPVCMASKDCNPKDYSKSECHGCNEIIEL